MIKKGSAVGWQWGSGIATGVVTEIHHARHEITSKGKVIARNGTNDDPAVVIKHDGGSLVIKLAHELQELHKSDD
jgi:hypothetical protein